MPESRIFDGRPRLVLLDRDGVINVDRPNSVRTTTEFTLIPGSAEGIALLNRHRIPVAIVTNQAVVGRDEITEQDLNDIHQHMTLLLKDNNAYIDAIYCCTSAHDHPRRKPEPGMLLEAIRDFGVKADQTLMIGDDWRDIQAAQAARCYSFLVLTGKGNDTLAHPDFHMFKQVEICKDLLDACQKIVQQF